jgi:hypothetical protein
MRYAFFTASLLLALPLTACILPEADEDDGAGTGEETEGETMPTGTSSGSESGSSEPTTTTPPGTEESGSSSESEGSTTDDPMPAMCTDATLLAGNPYFAGDLEGWNAEGHPMLGDPPLRSRHLAVSNGQLAVETQYEVWLSDGEMFHRVAGDEEELEPQYQPSGACADVRIIIGEGVAALPNGNLVVADTRGNGVIELADPAGDCTASPLAGTQQQVFDLDVGSEGAFEPGDVEGPGADARFFGPERPIADADGNVYLNDSGNGKIKRIANDADRTVSTVYELPADDRMMAMTVLNGMLYISGVTGVDDFIVAVDPATGESNELFRGRGLFEEIDSTQQASLFAASNDGVDLLLASQKGYIFRVSTAGEPLATVAGMGPIVDFPVDLDLTMPIALDQLPLRSYEIGDANLVRLGDAFVFTGNANGGGFHLWSINCG